MAPRKVGYSSKRFPGTKGMRAAAPATRFTSNPTARHKKPESMRRQGDSPSARPSAASPGRARGSNNEPARSPVPTSILSGAAHYFGPLNYPDQEYGKRRK